MALTFSQEIDFSVQLMRWGCTISECDEIIAVINRGNKTEINKCMSQFAPRIRNSAAFKMNANFLKQFM